MSNIVKRLSEYVANQIAAGEVVSGPSSVVKELMENAVDAGSEVVIVSVKGDGCELIQVVDDGKGMSFDDALTAFDRHATSKITDINDIYSLQTFGFRGEALASIAAVAEVELRTCQEEAELGTSVVINGGKLINHAPVACSKGSQFVVRNLFYNVPARRNFLKSKRAEMKEVISEFERVALCYPKISFFLYLDEQCYYNLPASNLRQRVSNLIGKQINSALIELYTESSIVEIRGYIGKPEMARRNSPHFMFVNGRYFFDSALNKAVQTAYEKLLPAGDKKMPPYFLYFTIDPSKIDVNVSPSKTRVKFDDAQSIFQILVSAVKESLGRNGIVPMIDFDGGSGIEIPVLEEGASYKMPELDINPAFNPFDENFSFSQAVEGHPESFRNSIIGVKEGASGQGGGKTAGTSWESNFEELGEDELLYGGLKMPLEEPLIEIESGSGNPAERNGERLIEIDEGCMDKAASFAVGSNYIVAYVHGRVMFVDITRAMMRICFEKMMRQITDSHGLARQQLLFPVEMELSPSDYAVSKEFKAEFEQLGFDFSLLDDNRIKIASIPSDAGGADAELLFGELLDGIASDDIQAYRDTRKEQLVMRMARICGKRSSSVSVTQEEMDYIIQELLVCSDVNYTPDGKRITASLTLADIGDMLNRR